MLIIQSFNLVLILLFFLFCAVFLAPINQTHRELMQVFYSLVLIGAILVGFVLTFLIDKIFSRRLTNLSDNIQHLSTPLDIKSRLPVEGHDEIALVAQMLNQLLTVVETAQQEIAHQNKLEGIIEMGGTICHEINQPLTALTGNVDILLLRIPEDQTALRERVVKLKHECERMGDLTRRLNNILRKREFVEKEYYKDIKILDIHRE